MSDNPEIIDNDIVDNTTRSRFEVSVGNSKAELVYKIARGRLVIEHTRVPDEITRRGIGGKLVAAAVDKAIEEDLTVVPICTFAAAWLRKHPEVVAKLSIEWDEDR